MASRWVKAGEVADGACGLLLVNPAIATTALQGYRRPGLRTDQKTDKSGT
jgi:hypothetical protein